MTEHLPECPWFPNTHEDVSCSDSETLVSFCDALRACERRVARETEAAMMQSFRMKPSPPHDQHYFADNICEYCVGYREAFAAARKAVAALPEYALRDTCVSAIDELREEKK